MNTSDNIDAIAAALAKAQGEIKNPHKSKDNPHFRSKYADIADGLEVARPVLSKHGLAIIQATEVREDDFVIMRTRLVHTSGQFVEGVYPVGRLTKHTDLGACMTYAKRQSLFALIGIAGDTDDMDGADTGTADLGSKNRKPAVVARRNEEPVPDEFISEDQYATLADLIKRTNANLDGFLTVYRVESLADLRQSQFADAKALLERKEAKQRGGEAA